METVILGSNGVIMEQTIRDLEPKVTAELGPIILNRAIVDVIITNGPIITAKTGEILDSDTITFKIFTEDIPNIGLYNYKVVLNFPNGDRFPCLEKVFQVVT